MIRLSWPFGKKDASTQDILRELYGSREVRSGVSVTTKTAFEVATVFRCVGVLTDCVSTIPLRIYQDTGEQKVKAVEHPLYDIFACAPNPWQDSLQFRETIEAHRALLNNAYVFINRVRGKIVELIPIEPHRVSVEQKNNFDIIYTVTTLDGRAVVFPQESIWHIRGLSWNSWMGIETLRLAREAVGLSMATEQTHARLHKNGVRPTGVYSVDGTLTDKQYKELRDHITKEMAGLDNTGKPLILDRAAKWLTTTMNGVDSQHLETRKFQIEEICKFFNVMPIMVGFSDKTATYASAEQMFLAHNVFTARPLHRRYEYSINRNLLTKAERAKGFYAKFVDTEMLRGAAKDRAEYYAKGINAGWMTRNEARKWEDLDPIEGLDEPLSPANMVTGNPAEAADPNQQPEPAAPATDGE